MKKFFLTLIGITTILFASSCGGNSQLRKLVSEINNRCPISIDALGEVTNAKLDGNNVIVTVSMAEDLLSIETIQNNTEMMKPNVIQALGNNPSDQMRALVDILSKNNGSLTYEYIGKSSGKKATITITGDELKDISKVGNDPDAALDAQLAITNIHFPMQLDDVTTIVNVTRENGNVVYLYDIDEANFDLNQIEEEQDDVLDYLFESLRMQRDNVSSKMFIQACYNAKADIIYRYRGNVTGKAIDFKISIEDVFED